MSGGHLEGVVTPEVMGIGAGMEIGAGKKLIAAGRPCPYCRPRSFGDAMACMNDRSGEAAAQRYLPPWMTAKGRACSWR